MKRTSAILLLALLAISATAQINNPSSPGTTINPTNNAIPKRSNGTTFLDSCWIDDGTNATCSEPIITPTGVGIAFGAKDATHGALRNSSVNAGGFTFGVDVVNGTAANLAGMNVAQLALSSTTMITQASAGVAQIGNNNTDASGGLNLTTLSASGQITSTLATGTAPLVVASTTNVANLNASSLSGATFAAPGAIGGTTPSTGAFTTASVNATAPSASATAGLGYDSTTKTPNYNANAGTTSSFSGAWNIVNVTPVTLPGTSTTADQNLITVTIPAGTLNKALRGLRVYAAGVYSTAATSTAQITLKAKLCTVSGCGSGTVLSVCSIQTIALASVTVSGNTWVLDCLPITQTAGATASFERSGRLSIDLGSLTTAADSIFLDPAANATLGTIDTTAQLFLQVSIAFSSASASNVATQRQLMAETVN